MMQLMTGLRTQALTRLLTQLTQLVGRGARQLVT